ncbi:MAG: hypothetical protein DRJ50_13440, partial [Actinobacteria bacterium]
MVTATTCRVINVNETRDLAAAPVSPWSQEARDVEHALGSDADVGLTASEVQLRLERYGP